MRHHSRTFRTRGSASSARSRCRWTGCSGCISVSPTPQHPRSSSPLLIVLTWPSNPLGWVAEVDEQRRLLELCRDRGIWLLADEVYERIYYGGGEIGVPASSILRLCDRNDPVHVVQSFSKSYCMTGWR